MYIDHTHRENQKVVTKIIELLPGTLNFSNLTMKFREEGVLIMYMGVDKCTQVALDLLVIEEYDIFIEIFNMARTWRSVYR